MNDDPIETMLRTENAHIDDGGFTRRVLEALPPARNTSRLRAAVLLAATVLACVVVLVLGHGGALLATMAPLTDAVRGLPVSPAGILTSGGVVAMLIWICAATATAD
jgi:hypothetical protein